MSRNSESIDENMICSEFQEKVSEVLIRHKSILDIVTKLDEYNARINRAVMKSVTSCGCISIEASKQKYNKETLEELRESLENHVNGKLCEVCSEKIEAEMGAYAFYLASLCNTLGISLTDVIIKELNNLKTLGVYSLK